MIPEIHSNPPINPPADSAGEIVRRTSDAAKETSQKATTIKNAAKYATDTAKDFYQFAAVKTEDTLATSKEYVRQNPARIVLGAIAFGAAFGCLLTIATKKPTFRERYSEDPLVAVRDAIISALAPVAQRVHKGYDSARGDAGKVLHSFEPGKNGNSVSHRIGRIGQQLKFW